MKQKIFLLILLLAGLIACTKDDTKDDIQKHTEDAVFIRMIGSGEFEGEWIFDEHVVDTATLRVKDYMINVLPPYALIQYAKTLILNNVADITEKDYEDYSKYYDDYLIESIRPDSVVLTSFPIVIVCNKAQGYSAQNTYFYENTTSVSNPRSIAEGFTYNSDNKRYTGYIIVVTEEPILAVYNYETNLWSLKITLNKVYFSKMGSGDHVERIWDFPTPHELIYVAKRKVRDIE